MYGELNLVVTKVHFGKYEYIKETCVRVIKSEERVKKAFFPLDCIKADMSRLEIKE